MARGCNSACQLICIARWRAVSLVRMVAAAAPRTKSKKTIMPNWRKAKIKTKSEGRLELHDQQCPNSLPASASSQQAFVLGGSVGAHLPPSYLNCRKNLPICPETTHGKLANRPGSLNISASLVFFDAWATPSVLGVHQPPLPSIRKARPINCILQRNCILHLHRGSPLWRRVRSSCDPARLPPLLSVRITENLRCPCTLAKPLLAMVTKLPIST